MDLEKPSHSVYKIRYHMVTAVKYRKVLLNNEVATCIKEILQGISERYEIIVDGVGFDQDHIHIFCGAAPKMSPLRVISIVKSFFGCVFHSQVAQFAYAAGHTTADFSETFGLS